MLVERRAGSAEPVPGVHVTFSLLGGLHRLPRLLGDDADEVLLDDDLHDAGHAANRALVDAHQRGADGRRPHDAAVQHAGHAHVVHELELAGHHRGHVDAGHRRAEHGPLAGRLSPRPSASSGRLNFSSADELAVGHTLRAGSVFDADRRRPGDES